MAKSSVRHSRDKAHPPQRLGRRAQSSSPTRERRWPDCDLHYEALRLRGLAGLIRSASKNEHDTPNLDDLDVSFFISTELHEIADKLEVA